MPRRKEVDSLQELANRVLISFFVECCRQFCTPKPQCRYPFLPMSTGRALKLTELRNAVAALREQILNRMPPKLLADFSASFINECDSFVLDESEGQAVLEMIMDIEIVGLRLTARIIRYLTSDDAPRLRRLKELDLSKGYGSYLARINDKRLPVILEKLYLNDLTLFRYPRYCTDSNLEIIGRNCPNLEVLDVSDSRSVTDAGLRFLSSCPNLRGVNVDRCPEVTHVSLSFLLSGGHKKLEDFSYGNNAEYRWVQKGTNCTVRKILEYDMLSGLDLTVQCPSLTRFVYQNNCQAVKLNTIVTKFPNLTSLRIECLRTEDLSAVKNLIKLTELNVIFDQRSRERMWLSIQEALTVIGANLTSLTLLGDPSLKQGDVNFIFDSCPNLKYFHIYKVEIVDDILVVPPFPKLNELILDYSQLTSYYTRYRNYRPPDPVFGIMLNLEILTVPYKNLEFFESMLLDNVKFPKLVKINYRESEHRGKCMQNAIENDRDFFIHTERNPGCLSD